MFNSTIMSNFIKNYWGDIKFVPKASIMNTICSEIMYRLDKLVYDPVAAQPKVAKILSNWKNEQGAIISAWLAQVNNGQLTSDAFMELLKENMLQHEIKSNSKKDLPSRPFILQKVWNLTTLLSYTEMRTLWLKTRNVCTMSHLHVL